MRHGSASNYKNGCRCDECRAANADAMRRYRAGERSPWGRGQAPSPTRRALVAARRLLDSVMRDRGGWSVFGAELDDEGQEAAGDLQLALKELGHSKDGLGSEQVTPIRKPPHPSWRSRSIPSAPSIPR